MPLDATRQRAFQLLRCNLRLIQRLRIDQIANRFRLGQVDAAVQKSAHRELAGFGGARSCCDAQFHDVAQDDRRSVGRDFNDIVGRVGMGLGEVSHDNFVDALSAVWRGHSIRRRADLVCFDSTRRTRLAPAPTHASGAASAAQSRALSDLPAAPRRCRRAPAEWQSRRWCHPEFRRGPIVKGKLDGGSTIGGGASLRD